MKMYFGWTLLFVLAEAVVFFVSFLLRKKDFRPAVRIVLIIFKTILAIVFAVLPLAGPVELRPVQPFLVALYAALFSEAVADAVYSVVVRLRKKERKFVTLRIISLVFGILFFVYGTVNMQLVLPNYHTYTSKKLKTEHKIIFISDIHIGSAQSFETFEKTVDKMVSEKPECIILGGDITDDYTLKDEMQNTFRVLGETGIPVYYLYGNHDRQSHAEYANGLQYTEKELEKALTDNGIIILKDEYASLGDDLLLLGREDISETERRAKADALKNPSPEKYLVVADHQPFEFKDNLVTGTDLQLSGHTHAGQLFPLKSFYSIIGYSYGDFSEGDAILNVSAGACGWRVPFRTDSHCYFEVITLSPVK